MGFVKKLQQEDMDRIESGLPQQQEMPMSDGGDEQFEFPRVMERNYDENFLKYSLETEKILQTIEHILRSEFYSDVDKKYIPKKGAKPLLNEYGLNKMLVILRPFLDKITTLSNFDQADIEHTMEAICYVVIDTLYDEWECFGLQSPENPEEAQLTTIEIVYEVVVSSVYASLLKGKNGFQQKIIGRVYNQDERSAPQNSGGGLLRKFNPLVKS